MNKIIFLTSFLLGFASISRTQVGIGTTTPQGLLELSNTDATTTIEDMLFISKETSGAVAAGLGAGVIFSIEDAGGIEEQVRINAEMDDVTDGSEDASLTIDVNQAGTMTEVFRVDGTSGFVGIGASSPQHKLDVYNGDVIISNSTANNGLLFVQNESTTYSGINFLFGGTGHAGFRWDGTFLELTDGSASGSDPDLWSATELMTWDVSSGTVGINNVDAPTDPLHIRADAGGDNIHLEENSGGEDWQIGIDADGDLNFEDEGTSRITFEDGGQVGIGTASPSYALEVVTGTSNYGYVHSDGTIIMGSYVGGAYVDAYFGTISNHDLHFYTNNSSALVTIHKNGFMGINDTDPNSHLEVKGSLSLNVTSISSATTLTDVHNVILTDASGGAFTITLPAASGNDGRVYYIKESVGSTNTITIDGDGTENIDGVGNKTITTAYGSMRVVCDGSNWFIID